MNQYLCFLFAVLIGKMNQKNKNRAHPGLNRRPLDLQSNALPLSYTPSFSKNLTKISLGWLQKPHFLKRHRKGRIELLWAAPPTGLKPAPRTSEVHRGDELACPKSGWGAYKSDLGVHTQVVKGPD